MPKLNFTALALDKLAPQSKTVEYFDAGRSIGDGAFGLRVSPKGKKTWFILYYSSSTKRTERFNVGAYPKLSLKAARQEAARLVGSDPVAERKEQKRREELNIRELSKKPTMNDLWKAYQDSLDLRQKPKSEAFRKEEIRRWRKEIKPRFGDMRVEDVQPAHLAELLKEVAKKSPTSSNRLHSQLSIMFQPALELGWIVVHPLQWVKKQGGAEPARKRILNDDEIKALWPYFSQVDGNAGDIFKLILLTCQRPGEVMSMQWEDLDIEEATWTQTTNKTDVEHIIPLSDQALQILTNRKETGKYVFPATINRTTKLRGGEAHAKCTKTARYAIHRDSGIDGWTAHDLRRTSRTLIARLGISDEIGERILNHSVKGVRGIYNKYSYLKEKRSALNKLGKEIDRINGIKSTQKQKVVRLQKQA